MRAAGKANGTCARGARRLASRTPVCLSRLPARATGWAAQVQRIKCRLCFVAAHPPSLRRAGPSPRGPDCRPFSARRRYVVALATCQQCAGLRFLALRFGALRENWHVLVAREIQNGVGARCQCQKTKQNQQFKKTQLNPNCCMGRKEGERKNREKEKREPDRDDVGTTTSPAPRAKSERCQSPACRFSARGCGGVNAV